ncbi:hypothetical protein PV350_04805 [Streptomyces sp. PA03-6a]|nr:hypothetical protein [Streptomyces sp. PA03-6a]
MTLLDDRPVTGLTTPYPCDASFDWPTGLSAMSTEVPVPVAQERAVTFSSGGRMALPAYVRDIEEKINQLLALQDGWNHRGAKAVRDEAVWPTIQVLLAVMNWQSLPVQLFPLPSGGIQAEWHAAGNSIEIEIDADGEPFVSAESSDGRMIAEGELDPRSMKGLMKDTRRFLAHMSRLAANR